MRYTSRLTDDYDFWRETMAWKAEQDAAEAEEREDYLADQAAYGDGNPLLGRKDNLR